MYVYCVVCVCVCVCVCRVGGEERGGGDLGPSVYIPNLQFMMYCIDLQLNALESLYGITDGIVA